MSDQSWPKPVEVDGVMAEAVYFDVVDVSEDGTRTVRVWVMWGDTLRHSDVTFDRETWDAAKAREALEPRSES